MRSRFFNRKVLFSLLTVVVCLGFTPMSYGAGDLVDIQDPNLRRAIVGVLKKPANTPITRTQMKTLTKTLRASNKSIRDLTGLEFAVNLKTLFLSRNDISDISPLRDLINLKTLVLSENQISDIAPLRHFRSDLITLAIDGNPVSDISPLRDLINLKTLVLSENQISDIAPLRNLKGLETLRLIDDAGGFENLRGQKLALWLEQGTSTVHDDEIDDGMAPDEESEYDDMIADEMVYDDEFLSSVGMWCATPQSFKPLKPRVSDIIVLPAFGESLETLFWRQADTVYPEASFDDGVVLTVRFMNGTPLQKARVKKFVPQWAQHAALRFIFIEENRPSDIRVRFEGRGVRSRSYIGNTANDYKGQPTLWLGVGYGIKNPKDPLDFHPELPPSVTILHEFGHALGLLHEQSNPSAALQDIFDLDLLRDMVTQWKMKEGKSGNELTDAVNVELCTNYGVTGVVPEAVCKQYGIATRLDRGGRSYTEFDSESIMLYYNLPLKGGGKTAINYHLSNTDKKFIGEMYPKPLKSSLLAPSINPQALATLSAAEMEQWLREAQQLAPGETALLSNYPNPFNPETWVPYHLSKPADVALTIYAIDGKVVRHLDLGHQVAGFYQSKSRAAYWDGRNEVGERVASGVYFYTLKAEDFQATRKMLIQK